MALARIAQGARRPSMLISWTREDDNNTPEDLTDATITAKILRQGENVAVESDGIFIVTDGENGVFRWDFSEDDVAIAGSHIVQFTAEFGDNPSPARDFSSKWVVTRSL